MWEGPNVSFILELDQITELAEELDYVSDQDEKVRILRE